MKKNIMLALLVSTLIVSVGCSNAMIESSLVTKEIETKGAYKINNELYIDEDKHIEIQYPKVVGYKDKLTENYMNQSIKDITEIYGYYSKYKNVEISYDISNMDNDVLSIVFTGTAKSDGAVSYKISETVSFNLLDSTNQISYAID